MILNNTEVVSQTSAINKVPSKPGLMGALGLYRSETAGSDAVTFDVRENNFHVLDDHLRNAAQRNSSPDTSYDIHTLALPHFPLSKTIGREKLAAVRQFDSTTEQTVANAVASELEMQAELHDLHEEYMLAQMTVNGVLPTDHYGTFSMATEFNVSRPTQTLAYTNPGDILTGLRQAQKKAKEGLTSGGRVGGYVMLCGEDLFEFLINSGDVVRAYELNMSQPNPLLNQIGEVGNGYQAFVLGNTTFILYDDSFTQKDGTPVQPLEDAKGVFLPRGVLGKTFYGPESTLAGLSAGGAKRFARSYMDPQGRYVEVSSEQNTLPILEQFAATVEVDFTP